MPDYDRLEKEELARYKQEERVVYRTDPKRKLTDKQIKKLLKKKVKARKSKTFLGIRKKKQTGKLSRNMRIRLL